MTLSDFMAVTECSFSILDDNKEYINIADDDKMAEAMDSEVRKIDLDRNGDLIVSTDFDQSLVDWEEDRIRERYAL